MTKSRVYMVRDVPVSVDPEVVAAAVGRPRDREHTQIENLTLRATERYRVRLAYRASSLAAGDGWVKIGEDLVLYSTSLGHFFRGCSAALLMASTLGTEVSERIRELGDSGRMDEAYMLDVIASEMADGGLDVARRMATRQVLSRGERVSRRRFSPGYGDVDLSVQLPLFERLQLEELGMSILPSFMLFPEKSVVALGGIGRMTR
ncbi:MAG: hypothetical protein R6U92_07360 [Bacillota bacterium]